jgi:hypothetical protein
MGLDFIHSRAPKFVRSWSRRLSSLAEPNLFANSVDNNPRTCIAVPVEGKRFVEGADYLVHAEGSQLVILDNGDRIGTIYEPPPGVVDLLRNGGCDDAVGTVERLHLLSGMADLSIR